MVKGKKATSSEITIEVSFSKGEIELCLLGESPLVFNSMSEHARQQLLLPAPKKNNAERATTLKHRPYEEYLNSVYTSRNPASETLLVFPATAPKRAIASAALDIPGGTKAELGRLLWVKGYHIPIWGTPQLMMSVVRSADQNKTPDIRTRAVLPEWAARIRLEFLRPNLSEKPLVTLTAAAGMIRGLGDWRVEKGSGSYGQFKIVDEDDPEFLRVCQQGRQAQQAGLDNPAFFDDETERLISWYDEELKRRGKSANGAAAAPL